MELKLKSCEPSGNLNAALNENQLGYLLKQLVTNWLVIDDKKLKKEFPFENYKRAMAFVQEIGLIAEKENHHPDICIYYNKVVVELTTKDVGGLTENDFILAAKIENL